MENLGPDRHLEVMHATIHRLRLRYGDDWSEPEREEFLAALAVQSWVAAVHRRPLGRSLVLKLSSGCPEIRWQLALAALGVQLCDPPGIVEPADEDRSEPPAHWDWVVRQIGANLMGAAIGQVLLGGTAGLIGAWLLGNRGALIFGSAGALLGTVVGAVAGGELADGSSPLRKGDLGPTTLQRLGGRLGEEGGASTGALLGAAMAGPAGAIAGMTIGSMVAGEAVEDLLSGRKKAAGVGRLSWMMKTGENQSGERVTQALMSSLGRGLSGGQDWGARIGSSVGSNVGSKVDWATSWSRHHLVHRNA